MLSKGPCLLFVDGRLRLLRYCVAPPGQPHPLLHAYGRPPQPAAPRRKGR